MNSSNTVILGGGLGLVFGSFFGVAGAGPGLTFGALLGLALGGSGESKPTDDHGDASS